MWCCVFFFFSSRRRHTRWNCDWSSDVCSSDLHGDHDQQQGKQRKERVVGDHGGERAAVVVAELAHDRERESQPAGTLLRAVKGPPQPFGTVHVSLLIATASP